MPAWIDPAQNATCSSPMNQSCSAQPANTAPSARIISGTVIQGVLSCTCSMVWWFARGAPWNVMMISRQE